MYENICIKLDVNGRIKSVMYNWKLGGGRGGVDL
jgi:hypothetical protein